MAYRLKNKVNAYGSFPSSLTGCNNFLKFDFNNTKLSNTSTKQNISSAQTSTWLQAGSTNNVDQNGNTRPTGLGCIKTIALDPNNVNTIYVYAETGGLWSINSNTLSVEDISSNSVEFSVYPNPVANEEFTVALEENFMHNNKADYTIYSYIGVIVKKGNII